MNEREKEGGMIRPGDVLLRKVEALPEGAVEATARPPIVLAEGEATGHAHVVEEPGAVLYEERRRRDEVRVYLTVAVRATVRHEEHAPVTLEPGVWEVVRQRHYEPQGWRRVLD